MIFDETTSTIFNDYFDIPVLNISNKEEVHHATTDIQHYLDQHPNIEIETLEQFEHFMYKQLNAQIMKRKES